jgi:hypothetical protein
MIPTVNVPQLVVLSCGAKARVRAATRTDKRRLTTACEGNGEIGFLAKLTEASVRFGVVGLDSGDNGETLRNVQTGKPVEVKRAGDREYPGLGDICSSALYDALSNEDVKAINAVVMGNTDAFGNAFGDDGSGESSGETGGEGSDPKAS